MGLIFPVHTKNINYETNIRSPLAVSVVYLIGNFSAPFQYVTKYKSFSSYLKQEVFSCERRRREAMLGGPGACPLEFFLKKKNGAIWCILEHILAFKTWLFFMLN